MNLAHLLEHLQHGQLSRRDALRLATTGSAATVLAALGPAAAAAGRDTARPASAAAHRPGGRQLDPEPIDDEMFDVAAVEAGAWVPGPYGPGDQRGALNEITPATTAAALGLLQPGAPVVTYNLAEELFGGFPAYTTAPPRVYEQRLTVLGYVPPPGFAGFLVAPVPLGDNRISAHEERITTTYHIATQLDNLNHVGVGAMFYNGFKGPDIARTTGTAKLGNEHMHPFVTRGLVLDIVGLKVAEGASADWFPASNGEPVLHDDYRITVEDIQAAMRRQRLSAIRPGDVVLLRTGWTHLVRSEPRRYLAREPGIYLREARWLAQFRPAVIGSDSWALEVLDPEIVGGNMFPVHQLLFLRYGIRIAESWLTDALVADGVSEFVCVYSAQRAPGATAGSTPPVALATPGRGR